MGSNLNAKDIVMDTMVESQWHSHWGFKVGQGAPSHSNQFAKNQEKEGGNQGKKKRNNWEENAKTRKVVSLAPPDR